MSLIVRRESKLRASVLKLFLQGKLSGRDLSIDLEGTTVQKSHDVFEHHMVDLDCDFEVKGEHLKSICDAVLRGEISPEQLAEIGFGMIASEHFIWDGDTKDGERVDDTLYDWASPEINYDLNMGTVRKFRHRLLTGESTFTKEDLGSPISRPILESKRSK